MTISDLIRDIPNFPKDGIIFRDVTTLFGNPQGLSLVTTAFKELWLGSQIDYIAGIDARGFIVGGALAYELKAGFIPLRKKGKLPFNTISEKYSLDYDDAEMEVHVDSCGSGDKVLVIDDLIATGGTAIAGVNLLQKLGANVVGCSFIVDLPDLGGSKQLQSRGIPVHSLCEYSGH